MVLLDNLGSYLVQVGSNVGVLGANSSYLMTFIFIIMVKSASNMEFHMDAHTEACIKAQSDTGKPIYRGGMGPPKNQYLHN